MPQFRLTLFDSLDYFFFDNNGLFVCSRSSVGFQNYGLLSPTLESRFSFES